DPHAAIIDLLHDAPAFDVEAASHLLAALLTHQPAAVTLAVVDPGVGGIRRPLAIETTSGWLVGPDNGLLSVIAAQGSGSRIHEILWRPGHLSATFHGRDLFAPVAARLANQSLPQNALREIASLDVNFGDADLAQVIYIDHYGNALTGLRACNVRQDRKVVCQAVPLNFARCFSDVPAGQAFWYENSLGLVEIAVNRGHASRALNLEVGTAVTLLPEMR
ncbi:MAG: SAM-dependent chlorinase/fluorinase, partial [Methylobacterium sp.]|nr:SAM-dependent chlorinase/fluorinase [Methylobacterium sp.]